MSCVEPIRKARLAATICTTAEALTQLTTSHAGARMHTLCSLLTKVPNKTTRSDLQEPCQQLVQPSLSWSVSLVVRADSGRYMLSVT